MFGATTRAAARLLLTAGYRSISPGRRARKANPQQWRAAAGWDRRTRALEVFLNDMRYINPRFTYLLTYGQTDGSTDGA